MAIGICLAAATLALSLPLQAFTLAWNHSIEKIRWEEDYQAVSSASGPRLLLTEARIRGTGAGMEMPPDAVLSDGVWHYTPSLAPLARLNLARWGQIGDYSVCWQGSCHTMADLVGSFAAAPLVQVTACSPLRPSDAVVAETDTHNEE